MNTSPSIDIHCLDFHQIYSLKCRVQPCNVTTAKCPVGTLHVARTAPTCAGAINAPCGITYQDVSSGFYTYALLHITPLPWRGPRQSTWLASSACGHNVFSLHSPKQPCLHSFNYFSASPYLTGGCHCALAVFVLINSCRLVIAVNTRTAVKRLNRMCVEKGDFFFSHFS